MKWLKGRVLDWLAGAHLKELLAELRELKGHSHTHSHQACVKCQVLEVEVVALRKELEALKRG